MGSFFFHKNQRRKLTLVIFTFFLLVWPLNTFAKYKKKIVIKPFSNPSNLNNIHNPGALIAKLLERSLKSVDKYNIIDSASELEPKAISPIDISSDIEGMSLNVESNNIKRHPAQLKIDGRVLFFQNKSTSSKAKVEIELIVRDNFTQRILKRKRFLSTVTQGTIVYKSPKGLDFNSPVFKKSAIGKSLMVLINNSTSFLKTFLEGVLFEAIIISVDNKKKEVIVNAGENDGLKPFDTFYIYSVNLNFIDPITQQNLGEKTDRQGMIKLKETLRNYSIAEITVGEGFKEGFVIRPVRK